MKLQELQQLDRDDPLRNYRSLFHLPEGVIYLDGNSLGPAPKEVFKKMEKVLRQEWRRGFDPKLEQRRVVGTDRPAWQHGGQADWRG